MKAIKVSWKNNPVESDLKILERMKDSLQKAIERREGILFKPTNHRDARGEIK